MKKCAIIWLQMKLLRGRRGFTRQPENSKSAHLRAPAFKNTTKIPREDPQRERQKERKWERERWKKKREIWPPHPSGLPTLRAPTFSGLGPHPSNWVHGAPPFSTHHRNTQKKHEQLISQKRKSLHTTKTLTLAKVGLAKVSFDRSNGATRCNPWRIKSRPNIAEVNIDFRIPGLPHSVLKHAETSRVRELVKKIENHPDRHALQRDLRQNKDYNPFSAEIKKNDSGSGQRRTVWIVWDGPQDAVQSMPIILEWRHRLLYMRASLERNSGQSSVCTLDLLSIPHGHRYGKTPEKKEYQVHNLKKRCKKREFKGIHDRFSQSHVFH